MRTILILILLTFITWLSSYGQIGQIVLHITPVMGEDGINQWITPSDIDHAPIFNTDVILSYNIDNGDHPPDDAPGTIHIRTTPGCEYDLIGVVDGFGDDGRYKVIARQGYNWLSLTLYDPKENKILSPLTDNLSRGIIVYIYAHKK